MQGPATGAARLYSGRGPARRVCTAVAGAARLYSGRRGASVQRSGTGAARLYSGRRPPLGGRTRLVYINTLNDISATRARIHTKYYLCTDNVCRRVPPPVGSIGPWGAGEWELKTQKIGGGLIRAADSYHFYFSQRCQM